MSQIKLLEDLKDFATYKPDLAKSLARVGKVPAPIVLVKKFQFTTKAVPMALVGPLDSKFKAALVAQKIPMKLGKCVRRDDGKIVLHALNAIEVHAAFEAAAVKDQIDLNGNFDDTGLGQVANQLDKHLKESGRATGDEDKRDQMAGKILKGMEKATNERNKQIDPSKPESHHVSAHGPGTGQDGAERIQPVRRVFVEHVHAACQESFSNPEVAKKFVEANKAIKTIELQLVEINKAHVKLHMAAKTAQKNLEKQKTSIAVKTDKLIPQSVDSVRQECLVHHLIGRHCAVHHATAPTP